MTQYDVGIVGLGVMGAQLARNVASREISIAGFERKGRSVSKTRRETVRVTW